MPLYPNGNGGGGTGSFAPIVNNFAPTACNIPVGTIPGTIWIDTSTTPYSEYIIISAGTAGGCDAIFQSLDQPMGCIPQICDNDNNTYITIQAGGVNTDSIEFVNNGVASGHINPDGQWSVGNGLPVAPYQLTVNSDGAGINVVQPGKGTPLDCSDASLKLTRGGAGDMALISLGNSVGGFITAANEDKHVISGRCDGTEFISYQDQNAPSELLNNTITIPQYPLSRDDSAYFFPTNFLYTDKNGQVLSSPVKNITNRISCLNAYNGGVVCSSVCLDCNNLRYTCGGIERFNVSCTGEICASAYPDTRKDGCSDEFLTTDSNGCFSRKSVKKGWVDGGTINAVPTAISPDPCRNAYVFKVDTNAGSLDFSTISTSMTGLEHGNILSFVNVGDNPILYTDPYTGFNHTFDKKDWLTLTFDSTNGFCMEIS